MNPLHLLRDFMAFKDKIKIESNISDHDIRDYNRTIWTNTSKSVFDFVKNIIVVSTLSFVSQKTDSYFLLFASAVLGIIILLELSSKIECFAFGWFIAPNTSKTISLVVSISIILASYMLVFHSISKLSVSLK